MTRPYGQSLGSSRDPAAWKRDVDKNIRKLDLGPFRFFYSREADVLQIQVLQQGENYYKAIIEIDRDGEFRTEDVTKTLQDLEDYGRT